MLPCSVPKTPVLVVDDEPANRLVLEALLGSEEYEVVSVASGTEALSRVAERDFAVVLMDVRMPGMNGFETATAMRRAARQRELSTPIIFLTSKDMPLPLVLEAYEGGAVDVIQKPSVPEIIRSKVGVFAELYRSREIVAAERARREASAAHAKAEALAEELSVTAARLETAQAVAGIGIFDWDLAQGRMYWSPEVHALMGLAPDDPAPRDGSWAARIEEEDRDGALKTLRDAIATGRGRFETELRFLPPRGGHRWVRITARITYDPSGLPNRLLGAIVDIERLKEAAQDLERANRAKDEFLATVSHELRTPLNAILGWTATLRRRNAGPEVDRALEVIERNARRQARLIDEVLDVSRIISGKLTLNVSSLVLADVVRAAIETVAPAAAAKQLRIVSELDPTLSIVADADRLQQVTWNLLANALKFTPIAGTISIAVYRESAMLCIRVADDGEGIPRDALPYIFEPFQQADASTTRRHGGLGLGLSIVKQIVAAHGGTIRAESEGEGRGARFFVCLPDRVARPVLTARPREDDAATSSTNPLPRLDGLSVLIVDDEDDARDILREVLREYGATVTTASSANGAFERLSCIQPDVIVSDIGMPDCDGYAFIRTLRQSAVSSTLAQTPALALTAFARKEDAQRAHTAGFDSHISKPVDPATLVSVVAELAAGGGRRDDELPEEAPRTRRSA